MRANKIKANIINGIHKSFSMLDKCISFEDYKKVQPFILNILNQSGKLIKLYKLQNDFEVNFNLSCLIKATEAKHKMCVAYSAAEIITRNLQ